MMPHSGRLNKNKKNRPSSGHFLLIKNNTDIIETRRSYKNLTNRIHEQWEPSNHDLNTGIYQRGKKTPDPNASVDSWLTFSGSQTEEAEGIVDAFAGKYFMGLDTRKPVIGVYKQQRGRPACASAQTDQHLSYSLFGKKSYLNLLQVQFQFSS